MSIQLLFSHLQGAETILKFVDINIPLEYLLPWLNSHSNFRYQYISDKHWPCSSSVHSLLCVFVQSSLLRQIFLNYLMLLLQLSPQLLALYSFLLLNLFIHTAPYQSVCLFPLIIYPLVCWFFSLKGKF